MAKKKQKSSGTLIAACPNLNCRSDYQDKRYGRKIRVHNRQGGKSAGFAKCTICTTQVRCPDYDRSEL